MLIYRCRSMYFLLSPACLFIVLLFSVYFWIMSQTCILLSSSCYHSFIFINLCESIIPVWLKMYVRIPFIFNRIIESAGNSNSNFSPEGIGLMVTHWVSGILLNKVVKCDWPQYIGISHQIKFAKTSRSWLFRQIVWLNNANQL